MSLRRRERSAVLAWSLFTFFAVLQVATIWQVWRGHGEVDQLFGVVMVGFALVGAVVAARRPDNAVGWLLIATAVAFSVQQLGEVYIADPPNPGQLAVAWMTGWSWYVWMTLVAVFLPLLFPDGRLVSPRWRPVAWLGAAALVLSILGAAFKPGELDLDQVVQNPLGVGGRAADVVTAAARIGDVSITVASLLAACSLAVRFRGASGVERQQLKWFAYAGFLVLAGLSIALIQVLFPGGWRNPIGAFGWLLFLFSCMIGVPAATGIAILRHGLYDIDLVIKRTLVYGSLTAMLLATYLALVLVFRVVLGPVIGESNLAVAGSTLAVAALFRPLRARMQAVVDRRFYRARYDAALTLEAFSARLRDELDLQTLGADLRHVVSDTMQPESVTLWLRDVSQ